MRARPVVLVAFPALLALAAAATACARKEAPQRAAAASAQYLVDVPRVPHSLTKDSTVTPEVEQRSFLAPVGMDSVASFYRGALPARGWRIVGGTSDSGQITILAQRGGQSLWVVVRQLGLGPRVAGYTLTSAAAADTSTRPKAPMLQR